MSGGGCDCVLVVVVVLVVAVINRHVKQMIWLKKALFSQFQVIDAKASSLWLLTFPPLVTLSVHFFSIFLFILVHFNKGENAAAKEDNVFSIISCTFIERKWLYANTDIWMFYIYTPSGVYL